MANGETVAETEQFSKLCKASKSLARMSDERKHRRLLFDFMHLYRLNCRRIEWHPDCVRTNPRQTDAANEFDRSQAMMEFRWVVFLVLWTILIGPVLDFTQHTKSSAHPHRAKTVQTSKVAR
jgi:hypothetical protein